ncbi:hypothetical protein LSH36_733g00031, partial [Paralvinella palmiformis]
METIVYLIIATGIITVSRSQTVCPDLTCGALNGTSFCPYGFDLDPLTGCQTCVC